MKRQRVGTDARWANVVGYSRAVRAGNHIFVAGTAAVGEDGKVVAPGDPYRQAQRCLEIIVNALKELGASPDDVVRTRIFVKDRAHWQEVGRAHGEIFGSVKPATTMVFAGMVDEEMLCEIEADAIVESGEK